MPQNLNLVLFFRKNILQIVFLVILIVSLVLTWFLFQTKHTFPEDTHLVIQEKFQKIVKDRLLEKNPLVQDVQFQELWTETTGQSKQIKAVFSYTFRDPSSSGEPVKVTVRGSALINQQSSSSDDIENWEVGSFDVDQTEMNFENEVIVISPPSDEQPATDPTSEKPQGSYLKNHSYRNS